MSLGGGLEEGRWAGAPPLLSSHALAGLLTPAQYKDTQSALVTVHALSGPCYRFPLGLHALSRMTRIQSDRPRCSWAAARSHC